MLVFRAHLPILSTVFRTTMTFKAWQQSQHPVEVKQILKINQPKRVGKFKLHVWKLWVQTCMRHWGSTLKSATLSDLNQ
jgi:hypothetical protein